MGAPIALSACALAAAHDVTVAESEAAAIRPVRIATLQAAAARPGGT